MAKTFKKHEIKDINLKKIKNIDRDRDIDIKIKINLNLNL